MGSIKVMGISRSGVAVTRLLCDPLIIQKCTKVLHAGNCGWHILLYLSAQNVPQSAAHFLTRVLLRIGL
jgi:hypothetical protein